MRDSAKDIIVDLLAKIISTWIDCILYALTYGLPLYILIRFIKWAAS